MNILSVVIDNRVGGIQNRILTIGNSFSDNIRLIILTPKTKGDFSNIAEHKGFRVLHADIDSPKYFSSVNNVFINLKWFLNLPLVIFKITKILNQENIDIVHVNGLLSLQAVIAAKIAGKPIVWHLISSIYPNWLILLLRPILIKWPDKIVFVTRETVNYYLGDDYPKNKVEIIYEPVDIDLFNADKIDEMVRINIKRKFQISNDELVVGFVGNINPQKGLEYFIKSASIIKKTTTFKVKFLIVGQIIDAYKSYFEMLIKLTKDLDINDDIIFTGKIPNLLDIISIMDIFLMTSVAEGTPIAILEAMSMKKPIIAPNIGGIPEQVINGDTGILVPKKDILAISDAIIYLLSKPDLRAIMGINGRKRIERLFSSELCAFKHEQVYRTIVKS